MKTAKVQEEKSMKANKKILATLLAVAMLFSMVPAKAFANTVGNMEINVDSTGRAVLTVDKDWQYQLAKATLAKEAILTSDQTAYVLLCSGTLKMYSYKYQKDEKEVKTVMIDTGVISISQDGYEKMNGHYNWLSDQEVRKKLGVDNSNNGNNTNNGSNTNNGNNTNTTNKIGVYKSDDGKTVLYNDGKNIHVLSQGQAVDEVLTLKNVVYIRYTNGVIKSWKITEGTTSIVLVDVASGTRGFAKDSTGNVTGYYDATGKAQSFSTTTSSTGNQLYVTVNNKVATVVVFNGNSIIATKTIGQNLEWAYLDSTNTLYCKDEKGDLYIWNYDIQKDSTSLVKIANNVDSAVTSNNNNKIIIIGYKLKESSILQPVWSMDQVKVAMAMSNTLNNTTSNTTKKPYNFADKLVVKGVSSKTVYDSNGVAVEKATWKQGTLSYMGMDFCNIKIYEFSDKGDLIRVEKVVHVAKIKKGKTKKTVQFKTYVLNKSTLQSRVLKGTFKSFVYDKNGFVTHVKLKYNGKIRKIKVS